MVEKSEDRAAQFIDRLGKLRQFSATGRRAPHKPLLLLYALAQLKHHGRDRVKYRDAERVLTPLLQAYGPTGTRARVANPFARLARISHRAMARSDRRLADADGAPAEVVGWSGRVYRGRARPSPPAGPHCRG